MAYIGSDQKSYFSRYDDYPGAPLPGGSRATTTTVSPPFVPPSGMGRGFGSQPDPDAEPPLMMNAPRGPPSAQWGAAHVLQQRQPGPPPSSHPWNSTGASDSWQSRQFQPPAASRVLQPPALNYEPLPSTTYSPSPRRMESPGTLSSPDYSRSPPLSSNYPNGPTHTMRATHEIYSRAPMMRPGQILQFNNLNLAKAGTPPALDTADGSEAFAGPTNRRLRVVQWNIERGYELEFIIRELQRLDPDILILQELDIGCRRTKGANIPDVLSRALQMDCVFATEFRELEGLPNQPARTGAQRQSVSVLSQLFGHEQMTRSERNAAGPQAFHGNAILSKFPIANGNVTLEELRRACPHARQNVPGASVTNRMVFRSDDAKYLELMLQPPHVFAHTANKNWDHEGWALGEPREGQRIVLAANILVPIVEPSQQQSTMESLAYAQQQSMNMAGAEPHAYPDLESLNLARFLSSHFTVVRVYCLHTEVFAGAITRFRQVIDAASDANEFYTSLCNATVGGYRPRNHPEAPPFQVVIGGDLNTHAHGVVRLSPKYAKDRMRWLLPPTMTEGEWFHRMWVGAVDAQKPSLLQPSPPVQQFQQPQRPPATKPQPNPRPKPWLLEALRGLVEKSIDIGSSFLSFKTIFTPFTGLKQYEISRGSNLLYFYDPFDVVNDITLNHPNYKLFGGAVELVKGKLDWCLLSGLSCRHYEMSNNNFAMSDHRALIVDVGTIGASAAFQNRWREVQTARIRGHEWAVAQTISDGLEPLQYPAPSWYKPWKPSWVQTILVIVWFAFLSYIAWSFLSAGPKTILSFFSIGDE